MAAVLAPFIVFGAILNDFFPSLGPSYAFGFPMLFGMTVLFFSLAKPTNRPTNPIQKIQFNYLEVRMLWRESRNRECKKCGYFDGETRDLDKPANVYLSAFAPCRKCGGKEFKYFWLDAKRTLDKSYHEEP